MPRPGAANGVVPKNGIGIAFWIAGVPGSADIVNVIVPSAIAAGISRLRDVGRAEQRLCHRHQHEERDEQADAAVGDRARPASTTARIARCAPSRSVMNRAIAATEPLSSISLPKTAPSRNSGKNCRMKPAAAPMNVMVQLASSGSCAAAAAISAATGASTSTLQPRNDSQTSTGQAEQDAEQSEPMASDPVQVARRGPASSARRGPRRARRGTPSPPCGPRRAACRRTATRRSAWTSSRGRA